MCLVSAQVLGVDGKEVVVVSVDIPPSSSLTYVGGPARQLFIRAGESVRELTGTSRAAYEQVCSSTLSGNPFLTNSFRFNTLVESYPLLQGWALYSANSHEAEGCVVENAVYETYVDVEKLEALGLPGLCFTDVCDEL